MPQIAASNLKKLMYILTSPSCNKYPYSNYWRIKLCILISQPRTIKTEKNDEQNTTNSFCKIGIMDCISNPENDLKVSIGQDSYYIHNITSTDWTKKTPPQTKWSLVEYEGIYEYLCVKDLNKHWIYAQNVNLVIYFRDCVSCRPIMWSIQGGHLCQILQQSFSIVADQLFW